MGGQMQIHNLINKMLLFLLFFAFAACSGNGGKNPKAKASGSNDDEILDPGITNQAPKISCVLTNTNDTSQTRVVDTIGEKDRFFSQTPTEGDVIQFDCSQTEDESLPVSFLIDTNYDPQNPQFVSFTNQNITLVVGRHNMALKAVDREGLERIKTFAMDAKCASGERPALSASAVQISTNSKLNFFNYSVNTSAITGGTGFQFAWDFNGDGVFDPYPMRQENGSVWIDSPQANNVYSIFASAGTHRRKAFLRVRNDCNLESDTITVNMPDEIQNIQRTYAAQAVKKSYYYLQSDIGFLGSASSSVAKNQRVNGPFIATQYPADSSFRRVQCTYDFKSIAGKARFTISGMNWYQGGVKIDLANEFIHGMEIRVNSIPDNGGATPQSYSNSDGVRLDNALYKVSAGDDGITKEDFNRLDQVCDIKIRIERAQAVAPCSSGSVEFSPVVATILLGEFDCSKLTNAALARSIEARNGKFYCEVAPVQQCVGGGGGGGGTPPTPQ